MDITAFLAQIQQPSSSVEERVAPVAPAAVAAAYFFEDESGIGFVDNSATWFSWGEEEHCPGGAQWMASFANHDGTELHPRTPQGELLAVIRSLNPEMSLRGRNGRGRVAVNHQLCLAPRFQGLGLWKLLRSREDAIYREWKADEVQLNAGCDALRSYLWFRKGFRMSKQQERKVRLFWKEYSLETGPGRELEDLPERWQDWPTGFQDWLVARVEFLEMYKVV